MRKRIDLTIYAFRKQNGSVQRKMPIFRKVKETEIADVAVLEKNIFSDAWSCESIFETYGQSNAMIVIAEEESRIVGYCILYFVLDEGEIARIGVDESLRGRGIGRGLLDFVKTYCVQNKIERLLLDVRESNARARKFYEQYGFEFDGIRKNFYEQPKEHAVLMSMTINNLFH